VHVTNRHIDERKLPRVGNRNDIRIRRLLYCDGRLIGSPRLWPRATGGDETNVWNELAEACSTHAGTTADAARANARVQTERPPRKEKAV
jgi:hypothetical protein